MPSTWVTAGVLVIAACQQAESPEAAASTGSRSPPHYVGRTECSACHQAQSELFEGSHHDLAMQPATAETVLGDFDEVDFTHFATTSTFYRQDGRFLVRTDGPDDAIGDFEIAYTFGVYPLQQYLVELSDGRLQTLPLCWDSRSAADGGQRWFHIYPDEPITSTDVLHWTGPNQNWNFMCAECHSTNVEKNYRLEDDRYETSWSEIDVSCESCHGPASAHVEWAGASGSDSTADDGDLGLVVRLRDDVPASWTIDVDTGIAERSHPPAARTQVETCARCHARRSVLSDRYTHGGQLLASHRPALLDDGLYYADGQILDEVYVYGSFLQSTMYLAGVTCSDCHDPHDLSVRGEANAVCAGCHQPSDFDTEKHHFHQPGSAGARCVECHMPAKTYMVVDDRRDHSLRVPRPDLSLAIGTPNACNTCHSDRSTSWARDAARRWWPQLGGGKPHYGLAIDAGRRHAPQAVAALEDLANDTAMPKIARATALSLLREYPGAVGRTIVATNLADPDPLVRSAAALAAQALPASDAAELMTVLLADPVLGVRIEATAALVNLPLELLDEQQRNALAIAREEYRQSLLVNADRPDSHLNLGVLHIQLGQLAQAEASYERAIALAPSYVPAHLNLADLYRLQDRDPEAEIRLRSALELLPESADAHHALGLSLVRLGRTDEALASLREAAELRPEDTRYQYVFAIALADRDLSAAIASLDETHTHHPQDRDILAALVAYSRQNGAVDRALDYARRLTALEPQNPTFQQLVEQLEAGR